MPYGLATVRVGSYPFLGHLACKADQLQRKKSDAQLMDSLRCFVGCPDLRKGIKRVSSEQLTNLVTVRAKGGTLCCLWCMQSWPNLKGCPTRSSMACGRRRLKRR